MRMTLRLAPSWSLTNQNHAFEYFQFYIEQCVGVPNRSTEVRVGGFYHNWVTCRGLGDDYEVRVLQVAVATIFGFLFST